MKHLTDTPILVIEDEDDIRNSIVDILSYHGFPAMGAENGTKGIEMINQHKPGLILCDIMLPEMDGFGVLHHFNHEDARNEVPFVFITALSDRKNFRQAMELGAEDYITKPFTHDELMNAVRTRLERKNNFQKYLLKKVEEVESDLKTKNCELQLQVRQQKAELNNLNMTNLDLGAQLIDKEYEITREIMKVIEVNNKIQSLQKMIKDESKRRELTNKERQFLESIKFRISNKNLFSSKWTDFQLLFSKTYPHFTSNLSRHFPGLSQMEHTLASCIAMNIRTEQLADMFNVQPESIRTSKFRLKKKLGLGPNDNLNDFIHEFKVKYSDE
ncbi:MAG TPA: hypothetical protein DCE78_05155 [Bacteroidetes bacterium]|nr:hypothetical protein [Bacteroidota bacterium]